MNQKFYNLAKQLGELLKQQQMKLVTAESCTGGSVATAITAVPGCSEWFERGFVTYSIESKIELLNVSAETIEKQGTVSKETVNAMAIGALQNSHADISLAITGIAGPNGGTKEKPVGTVWFAIVSNSFETTLTYQHFDGDRHTVQEKAVTFGLENLIKQLE